VSDGTMHRWSAIYMIGSTPLVANVLTEEGYSTPDDIPVILKNAFGFAKPPEVPVAVEISFDQ
jgi:hypothetical protein